ncbi:MAG: hypothetical protein LBN04_04900 [Oscillospiraceae bacterium]|jgi:hypothetical protein|nr:hypothetical protein [Oscillospiraceae bacterium]
MEEKTKDKNKATDQINFYAAVCVLIAAILGLIVYLLPAPEPQIINVVIDTPFPAPGLPTPPLAPSPSPVLPTPSPEPTTSWEGLHPEDRLTVVNSTDFVTLRTEPKLSYGPIQIMPGKEVIFKAFAANGFCLVVYDDGFSIKKEGYIYGLLLVPSEKGELWKNYKFDAKTAFSANDLWVGGMQIGVATNGDVEKSWGAPIAKSSVGSQLFYNYEGIYLYFDMDSTYPETESVLKRVQLYDQQGRMTPRGIQVGMSAAESVKSFPRDGFSLSDKDGHKYYNYEGEPSRADIKYGSVMGEIEIKFRNVDRSGRGECGMNVIIRNNTVVEIVVYTD